MSLLDGLYMRDFLQEILQVNAEIRLSKVLGDLGVR